MEFLQSRVRKCLVTLSQTGPSGMTVDDLIESMSPFLTKESVLRSLEELIFSGYVEVMNQGETTKLIASKSVRTGMIGLELARIMIGKRLDSVRRAIEGKDQGMLNNSIELLNGTVGEAIFTLMGDVPELTLPELLEILHQVRDKLGNLLRSDQKLDENTLEEFFKLVEKYKGERESSLLRSMIVSRETKKQESTDSH
jgi:hypothetical protein